MTQPGDTGALPLTDAIADRVAVVQEQRDAACKAAGRAPDDVTIIAVAKKFGPDVVAAAAEAGLRTIGENRVQEAAQKIPLCSGALEWHLIGHLQTNKVAAAVRLFSMIHSVDSEKLLTAIERACDAEGQRIRVCLQVNVSGERSKFGLAPDDVPAVLDAAMATTHVDVVGLMTIPPFDPDAQQSRPYFENLRELRDGWRDTHGFPLSELSMGMSSDFPVAIAAGATMIRLGTAIFGDRRGQI
ncbi:MAG: YggS family pyridoxal phosphate-dependent enzyme [Verrucomicrobia bacterium]|nr:YggS family pyridoxal phosphate-dependent enzyme [Verrucomicrobiota bacterium]